MIDIEAVNFDGRIALLTDGTTVPVTLIDGNGDETDEVDAAVAFVCGRGGVWFSDLVSNYGTPSVQ